MKYSRPQPAQRALAARDQWVNHHLIARAHLDHVAAGRRDRAREFVAHDQRRDTQAVVSKIAGQLASADADGAHANDYLIRLRRGDRRVLKLHLAWA